MTKILIVDDEKAQRESLAGFLKKLGYETHTESSAQTALAYMYKHPVDIVLSDYKMPYMTGSDLLQEVRSRHPDVILVLITAYGTVDIAVHAMKAGAWDFLSKPLDLDQLEALIQGIEKHIALRRNVLQASSMGATQSAPGFIAEDPAMIKLLAQAKRVAPSQATILITGETGVGKEVLAEYIHVHSSRKDAPKVSVNCAALPSHLIESELFGHEKGAFTGATSSRIGRFEEAHLGTLFLDEIGDLPLEMQTKLLRFLQSGEFQRIGENRIRTSDVRVLAATNVDLEHAVAIGEFREDLYYRLNVINLNIPPLRERRADIKRLAQFFLDKYTTRERLAQITCTESALEKLQAYDFPGNVRELGNIIERAVLLAPGPALDAEDLALSVPKTTKNKSGNLNDSVAALEAEMIATTLAAAQGNQSECARRLGISERVLRYKLQKYELP